MDENLTAGTILIKEGTPLPEGIGLESAAFTAGWRSAPGLNSAQLDHRIRDAGWTYFFMAGETKVLVFGADREATRREAVRRILAKPEAEQFNSLEITSVASKRFLGLSYVTVSAHWRHIQEGLMLFHSKPRIKRESAELRAA